jgi:hypothetical protein
VFASRESQDPVFWLLKMVRKETKAAAAPRKARLEAEQSSKAAAAGSPADYSREQNPPSSHEDDGADTSFRNTLINAWISSRMERDKSLLTVSAAAVGLLVALLQDFDEPALPQFVCYIVAFGAFATAIVTAIKIFGRNSDYIFNLVSDPQTPDKDPELERLDNRITRSFYIGLVALALLCAFALLLPSTLPREVTQIDEQTERARPVENSTIGRQPEEPEQLGGTPTRKDSLGK